MFFSRGATIAKIVSLNVLKTTTFDHTVKMWVHEEMVDGRKISDILNEHHENIKYLPGIKIPDNVVSMQAEQGSLKGLWASNVPFVGWSKNEMCPSNHLKYLTR